MSTRRTKPTGAYEGREDAFQIAAINLCRAIGRAAGVDPKAIMHIPNGGARNAIVGKKMKAQGTVPGYPDIMVFKPIAIKVEVPLMKSRGFELAALIRGEETVTESRVCCGLALELKVWDNKPSPDQLHIHDLLRSAGWRVAVCYGLGEVERAIREYLGQ